MLAESESPTAVPPLALGGRLALGLRLTHAHLGLGSALVTGVWQRSLGGAAAPLTPLLAWLLTGFVYSLNALTDADEDASNDPTHARWVARTGTLVFLVYATKTRLVASRSPE